MNAPLRRLSVVVAILFASLLVSTTWIQFVTADRLNADSRNARTLFAEYGRERGPILVSGEEVALSEPAEGPFAFLRSYPEPEVYAHLTGHYSVVYGPTGMEAAGNDVLAGTADRLFYRRVGDLLTGEQVKGASVELTVDPAVQRAAWEALGDQRGAVVALDPQTGDVLALVSKPSYDPNRLASHDTSQVVQARTELLDDAGRPLENRATGGRLYPPGSVFKLVTAAAALSSGEYTEATVVPGPAELDLPQTDVTLPNSGGGACGSGGRVSLTDAMRISCNTAFGFLGLELGDDALREQAQQFGFGEALRIPLPVTASTVPEEMNPPQTAQAAIGQFDVRVTPLQVAMVTAAIANDGVLMQPQLVRTVQAADLDVIDEPQPQRLGEPVSAEVAAQLTRMMVSVVESGTGRAAALGGVQVAGKSGTAQQGEGRSPHAWFTAFAPVEDPQVAVAVVVEDGGRAGDEASGGRTAAPIARQVIEAVVRR